MWNKLLVTGCIILMVAGSSLDHRAKNVVSNQKDDGHQEDPAKEKKSTKQKRSPPDYDYYPSEYVPPYMYYPEHGYEHEPCEHDEHHEPEKYPKPVDHHVPYEYHENYQGPHYTTTTLPPHPLLAFHRPLLDLLLSSHDTTTTTTPPPYTTPPHHGYYDEHGYYHTEYPHHYTTTTTTTTPAPSHTVEQLTALLGRVRDAKVQGVQSAMGLLFHQPHSRSAPSSCDCMEEINQLQHAILLLQESIRQLKIAVEAEEGAIGKTKVVKIAGKTDETE